MALERKWEAVSQAFTADGTQNGIITVADASGFYAKQKVTLISNTQPSSLFEVRRITRTTIQVGDIGSSFNTYSDVSKYLVADSAQIIAPEQEKPTIRPDDIFQALYNKDPSVALRNLIVDKFGIPIESTIDINGKTRLAVDADVTVNTVQLFTKPYDAITALYPTSTQEIYQSRIGGIAGTIQETATVNYTDATKNFILNVART